MAAAILLGQTSYGKQFKRRENVVRPTDSHRKLLVSVMELRGGRRSRQVPSRTLSARRS